MYPRKLTRLAQQQDILTKAAFAPRPSIEDALQQLRRYVSLQLREADGRVEERLKDGWQQGYADGFKEVVQQVPSLLEQQQHLTTCWFDWIRASLLNNLPEKLVTFDSLNLFVDTLISHFKVDSATLWLPVSMLNNVEDVSDIEERCIAAGLDAVTFKMHEEPHAFRLECGPLVWEFNAVELVRQHAVLKLDPPVFCSSENH